MFFIKVTNYVDQVNRLGLEKLGLSTKRDNDETIGQFGSGVKFAPIAAIRSGNRFIFTGNDTKGSYVLEYKIKSDEGIPCVFYDYGDYEKPSSFTADAGLLSWTEPFQIMREIIANAIDESKVSGLPWDIKLVNEDDIKPVEGEFSVYISADLKYLEIYNDFDKYFSVNRTPLTVSNGYRKFKVYEPIDEYMRVYCKGVLVYSSHRDSEQYDFAISGLYDYEFDDLGLNEERTVKSIYDLNWEISGALSTIRDESMILDIIEKVLDNETDNYYEFLMIPEMTLAGSSVIDHVWCEAFNLVHDNGVIVAKENFSFNTLETIRSRGYEPVVVYSEKKYAFLSAKSIKTLESIFGDKFNYNYTMNIDIYEKLLKAIDIVDTVFKDSFGYFKDSIGVLLDDESQALGMNVTIEEERTILISENHIFNDPMDRIVSTLVHELDHFSSGITDGNTDGRMFRELADRHIGQMAVQLYKMMQPNDSDIEKWCYNSEKEES